MKLPQNEFEKPTVSLRISENYNLGLMLAFNVITLISI
jgi:hypothetical protein